MMYVRSMIYSQNYIPIVIIDFATEITSNLYLISNSIKLYPRKKFLNAYVRAIQLSKLVFDFNSI